MLLIQGRGRELYNGVFAKKKSKKRRSPKRAGTSLWNIIQVRYRARRFSIYCVCLRDDGDIDIGGQNVASDLEGVAVDEIQEKTVLLRHVLAEKKEARVTIGNQPPSCGNSAPCPRRRMVNGLTPPPLPPLPKYIIRAIHAV